MSGSEIFPILVIQHSDRGVPGGGRGGRGGRLNSYQYKDEKDQEDSVTVTQIWFGDWKMILELISLSGAN